MGSSSHILYLAPSRRPHGSCPRDALPRWRLHFGQLAVAGWSQAGPDRRVAVLAAHQPTTSRKLLKAHNRVRVHEPILVATPRCRRCATRGRQALDPRLPPPLSPLGIRAVIRRDPAPRRSHRVLYYAAALANTHFSHSHSGAPPPASAGRARWGCPTGLPEESACRQCR
jgi:hypothetical protein